MAPMYNIIKAAHCLALESILTHKNYFTGDSSPSEEAATSVREFFEIWKYSETDFGLNNELVPLKETDSPAN